VRELETGEVAEAERTSGEERDYEAVSVAESPGVGGCLLFCCLHETDAEIDQFAGWN
jgi:hypothetical protein